MSGYDFECDLGCKLLDLGSESGIALPLGELQVFLMLQDAKGAPENLLFLKS